MTRDEPAFVEPLNPALHHFDVARFGTLNLLRNQAATEDGWRAVMIGCSETGCAPDLNSLFDLGQLLILQNFGNVVVPLSGSHDQSTEATLLLREKKVKHVIVCGHLKCRTIGHFLEDGERHLDWLTYGNELREMIRSNYAHLEPKQRLNIAAQENVLLQLEREIKSHKTVGVEAHVYGWILDDESHQVRVYDPESSQFELPK